MFKRFALARFATLVAALGAAALLAAGAPARAQSAAAPAATAADTTARPAAPRAGGAKAPKAARQSTKKPRPAPPPFEEQKKENGIWVHGSNWLLFGAGYAKRASDNAGDGLGGYGIAFRHMMTNRYSFDAAVSHDLVGHMANHYDEAVPFTAGISRHFRWNTPLRPFLGLGGGYFYRKFYRTGSDYNTAPMGGWYLGLGADSPLDDRHAIGFETRVAFVNGRTGVVNPVFGPGQATETLWTLKINWSLVY